MSKVKKPKAYTLVADTEVTGLFVRTTAAGVAAYVFDRRINKRSVRWTIGRCKDWKLKAARIEARRLATEYDQGHDPRIHAEAEHAKAEEDRMEGQRHAHVVEAVWKAYVEDRKTAYNAKKRRPAWGERHYEMHVTFAAKGGTKKPRGKGLTKPGVLAPLMPLKLSELTPETIAAWLKREAAKRPTNTAQAYRILRAFIQWTHDYEKDKAHPYRGIVPADATTSKSVRDAVPGSNVKEDVLELGQLPAWFNAVRSLGNPTIAAYLQSLLLVGARRNEWAGLKWGDVDFVWNRVRLRDKVDGERIIPLTPFVSQLLGSLPRKGKNNWVFPSARAEGGRLVEPRIAHNNALKIAGIEHLTLHGLRRSFATLADYLDEMPAGIVAQIMGHKPSATAEKHYKPRPVDLLGKWHTKLEAWILEQAGVQFAPLPVPGRLGVVASDGSVRAAV